jgi:dolichol-phosphate mannosyltransferase
VSEILSEKYLSVMNLFFLIPVFNESANLDLLAENLEKSLSGSEKFYLFVDDKSTDDTIRKIHTLFQSKPYYIIEKEKNQGPGDSFNLGFEWILEHSEDDRDLVITLEADNTSDIDLLPTMIGISALNYSLVLASVYAQGGGFEKSSFFRKLISFFANIFMRFIFKIKVQTLSSFYRVYEISLIRKIRQNYTSIISEKGFVCMFEILLKAVRLYASIIEVPMVLKSLNRKDKSKMKVLKTMAQYTKFVTKLAFRGLN